MNRFNVFITVLVCAGLCVLFGALSRSTEDATGWNPSEMYTSTLTGGSSFTNAAYSGSSNSGVALPMPSASFSSRVGAHVSYNGYSASPASGVSSQLPSGGSSAVVGHMTSSAVYHSFGGGGNAAAGSSSMARRSSSMNASPISYNALSVGSISLPTAPRSSSANNAGYTPSLAQEANYAIASSNMQGGLFDYALQTTYGTASYEAVYGNSSSRRVNGAMRLPGTGGSDDEDGFGDDWLNWLGKNGSQYGSEGENGSWGFDIYQLEKAYLAWRAEWCRQSNLDKNLAPSFDDFLLWFWSNEGNHTYYWTDGSDRSTSLYWVPVGGILPLLLMALLYAIILFVKRNKTIQL